MLSGQIYFKMPPNLSLIPRRERHKLLHDLAYTPGSPLFYADEETLARLAMDFDTNELRILVKRLTMEAF